MRVKKCKTKTISIPYAVEKLLEEYADRTEQSQSKIIADALVQYIKRDN